MGEITEKDGVLFYLHKNKVMRLITTTDYLQGVKIQKFFDAVFSNIVIGNNFFSEFKASITDVFGGHSIEYENKITDIYNEAVAELVKQSEEIGANALIGLKIGVSEIAGKGMSMFMLHVTGTPVFIEEEIFVEHQLETKTGKVSYQQLKRDRMIDEIMKSAKSLDNSQWSYIFNNPDIKIFSKLLETYAALQLSKMKGITFNEKQHLFVSNLEKLSEKFDPTDVSSICYNQISIALIPLIKKNKIFEPIKAKEIFKKGDWDCGFELLKCDKKYYDQEDLINMKELINLIDSTDRVITEEHKTLEGFRKQTNSLERLLKV